MKRMIRQANAPPKKKISGWKGQSSTHNSIQAECPPSSPTSPRTWQGKFQTWRDSQVEKCFVGLRPSAAGHPPKRCDRFCLTWQFSKSNVRVKTGNPQAFEKDVPCQNHDWKPQFGLLNFFDWRETGLGHGRKSFPLKGNSSQSRKSHTSAARFLLWQAGHERLQHIVLTPRKEHVPRVALEQRRAPLQQNSSRGEVDRILAVFFPEQKF